MHLSILLSYINLLINHKYISVSKDRKWGTMGTKISVLTKSDGLLVWRFKVVAKVNSSPENFCGEF